jgi:hypothetical protein
VYSNAKCKKCCIRRVATAKFEVSKVLLFHWLAGLELETRQPTKHPGRPVSAKWALLIFSTRSGTYTCFELWQWYMIKSLKSTALDRAKSCSILHYQCCSGTHLWCWHFTGAVQPYITQKSSLLLRAFYECML